MLEFFDFIFGSLTAIVLTGGSAGMSKPEELVARVTLWEPPADPLYERAYLHVISTVLDLIVLQ